MIEQYDVTSHWKRVYAQFIPFYFYLSGFRMHHLTNIHHENIINDYLESYLNNKAPDCILYSEDGFVFKTHKELFGLTTFMRKLLEAQNCCGVIELIVPCSKEDLCNLIFFITHGKIQCDEKNDCFKIIENLNKILGFPRDYLNDILASFKPDVLDDLENSDRGRYFF